MTALDRLTAYLCQQPGTENLDAHHADFARQILDQHARELAEQPQTVIGLADRLRETATALANRADIAATDDPLTLLRCLHATVEALALIAPDALVAADITEAPDNSEGIANIPALVALGLKGATNALWDACNAA